MLAVAFLRSKTPPATGPAVVLVGEERHLKLVALERLTRQILGDDDAMLGLTRFSGEEADLKSVCDELLTVSMWGDRRLVVVDAADKFVSQSREGLEKYLKQPARKSVLVLDVKTWPKTTRLAKLIAKIGLEIECAPLSTGELVRWIGETARNVHGKTLGRDAAMLIVELVGDDLGLIEQELAKLAAYVGNRPTVEDVDVRALVGGWKTETTWAIAAAVRQGNSGEALDLLAKLLDAGESPHKILGGLTFVFRRLAQAVERVREGAVLESAVREAGIFPREIGESEAYLRRLGRADALRTYSRLLTADENLKGALIMSERHVLENLVVKLSGTSALSRRN